MSTGQYLDALPLVTPMALFFLALVYAVAAVFSGLSGFGFSAIGCLTMTVLSPQLGVVMLMALSLVTQAIGLKYLWQDLRKYYLSNKLLDSVMPYMCGGLIGMPIGLAVLFLVSAKILTLILGSLLIFYAVFSLQRQKTLFKGNYLPGVWSAFSVGAAGGLVGGFSAFPGSTLVVWNSLRGTGKDEGRALTQPFILFMQVAGLSVLSAVRPETFDVTFWRLFALYLPIALLGNWVGLSIYRKTGELRYRKVTLFALAFSGAGLLLKTALT